MFRDPALSAMHCSHPGLRAPLVVSARKGREPLRQGECVLQGQLFLLRLLGKDFPDVGSWLDLNVSVPRSRGSQLSFRVRCSDHGAGVSSGSGERVGGGAGEQGARRSDSRGILPSQGHSWESLGKNSDYDILVGRGQRLRWLVVTWRGNWWDVLECHIGCLIERVVAVRSVVGRTVPVW